MDLKIRLLVFIKIIFIIFFSIFCQPLLATASEPDLKQKIGQMLILGFSGDVVGSDTPIVQDILKQKIGGVVLFAKNPATGKMVNIVNPQQLKQLTQSLQDYARQAAVHRHNSYYPLFIAADYEGGRANPLKQELGFPDTFSAAEVALLNDKNAGNAALAMATTLKRLGFNLNFAPVVDVNVNPDNPVISHFNRSFSTDPKKVTYYARLYTQAFHDQKILCAYKHFPGHGSSSSDSHHHVTDITSSWRKYELAPYQQLLSEPNSCDFIMVGHLINRQLDPSGLPASLSKKMIAELLRQQLNFKGIVITDDLQMKAIRDHFTVEETVQLAINAGVDILVFANQFPAPRQDAQQLIDMIYSDVKQGKISEQRINEAYARILKLKLDLSKN